MRKMVLLLIMISLVVAGGVLAIMLPPRPAWLTGSTEDKVEKLGLIQPSYADFMLWTGIRLNELYVGGLGQKWLYAKHQAIKISEALKKAAVVDPTRKEGIEALISGNYPGIIEAIDSQKIEEFQVAFGKLYASCNNCHVKHGVPFLPLIPTTSISPITSGSLELWQEIQKHMLPEEKEEEKKEEKKE